MLDEKIEELIDKKFRDVYRDGEIVKSVDLIVVVVLFMGCLLFVMMVLLLGDCWWVLVDFVFDVNNSWYLVMMFK